MMFKLIFATSIKTTILAMAGFALQLPVAMAASPSEEGVLFQNLKQAYASSNTTEFNRWAQALSASSVFKPYLDIWTFRLTQRQLANGGLEENAVWPARLVLPLLEKHANTWPAEALRRDWLAQMAGAGQWRQYQEQRALLRYRPDQALDCADMIYAAQQGQLVQSKINEVLSDSKPLPKTCRKMIRSLYEKKSLQGEQLDTRVFNLAVDNQPALALKFAEEFSDTDWGARIDLEQLRSALFKPEAYIQKANGLSSGSDIYLACALAKTTKDDPKAVAQAIDGKFSSSLSEHSKKWLWAHVGYRLGLLWDKDALASFKRSSAAIMNREQLEWKTRSALLLQNWSEVLQSIEEMPEESANSPAWSYWKGRALAAKGDLVNARLNWIRIGEPFSFYGKLALEELGETLSAPQKPKLLTAQELDEVKNNPGLLRSLALYDAGLRTEGFWEFNLQTAQMSDRQLLATATWANKNQLYDRAIAAADRTQSEHDLSLRYLTPFKENMRAKTDEIGVDQSWVYGLIRQESRFSSIARSGVGASGLMQVMPDTAKYVARKIGLSNFSQTDITEINTNLTLGTSYLKMIYERLDNSPVLASAGYNAGPGRPAAWKRRLGNLPMEGALFTELIPFDETRNYVKNVMSNTVAYSLLLNNASTPLKQRLGTIRNTD